VANIIRPIAGTISTWTALAFTAGDLNSCSSTGAALSTTIVAQSTNLDSFLQVSFVMNASAAPSTAHFLALYLLPKNQDGTTYGDGYVSSKTNQPGISYWVTNASPNTSGITTPFTMNGSFPRVFIGDLLEDFEIAIAPGGGLTLNATASATVKYKTLNTNANG
jgi:hypothetical protein